MQPKQGCSAHGTACKARYIRKAIAAALLRYRRLCNSSAASAVEGHKQLMRRLLACAVE